MQDMCTQRVVKLNFYHISVAAGVHIQKVKRIQTMTKS